MKSFRRIIAAVLSFVMVLLMIPQFSFEATAQTTSLYDLQSRYPDGKYWNHYVSSVANCGDQLGARNDESYGGSVTSTPCASHSATSAEYYVGKYDCNYFDGAWQCQGFARRLGFEAFGTKVTTWSKHNSVANIKPGDVIQFWSPDTDPTWGHGVFVTAVSGSIITVAEANLYGDPCRIRWGHQYNLSTAYKVEVYSAPWELDISSASQYIQNTYPSSGTLKVSADTAKVMTFPCSTSSVENSKTVETATKGDTYQVVGLVQNIFGNGNYWYEVETKKGGTGYIYSENTTFIEHDYGTVSISNTSVPTTINVGDSFSIGGAITSSKLQLQMVSAYVSSGSGASQTTHLESQDTKISGKTYSINNSAMAAGIKFNTLSAGTYKCVIGAAVSSYKADGNKLTGPYTKVFELYSSSLQVTKSNLTSIPVGDYYLRNNSTGKYLAVDGGIDASQQNISVADFTGGSEMHLAISAAPRGYIMRPHCANRIVNPYGDTVVAGMNVSLLGDLSDSSQWWGFEKVTGGYIIRNMQNQSCVLSINGNNVVTANYTGSAEQIWSLEASTGVTVTYNANGGVGAPAQQEKGYNQSLTIPSTTPTREGYTFVGWGVSDTATTPSYYAGSSYTANMSITLYAIWRAHTYTVSYNSNGGSGSPSPQVKTYGKDLILDTTAPKRTGYSFLGWATSSTATSASYQPGGTYTANSNVTLYAVWKANSYTVSYNANGGTGAPAPQTKTHGQSLTLSLTVPTREGYIFVGWATNNITNGVSYQPGGSYVANDGVTLYAVWEREVYTTYFDPNGGNISTSNRYVRRNAGETEIVFPTEIPTKDYCYFLGWSSAKNSKEAEYLPGETITVNKNADIIFYAVWEAPQELCLGSEYNFEENTYTDRCCFVFKPKETGYYRLETDITLPKVATVIVYDDHGNATTYFVSESIFIFLESCQNYHIEIIASRIGFVLEKSGITHIVAKTDKQIYELSSEYLLYQIEPTIMVYAGDSLLCSGTLSEIEETLNVVIDQNAVVLPAGTIAGEYKAEFNVGNIKCCLDISVCDRPVVDVEITQVESLLMGKDQYSGSGSFDVDSKVTFSVTLNDGHILVGKGSEIRNQLKRLYGSEAWLDYNVGDSSNWDVGTHKVVVDVMGYSKEFTIEVLANPVTDIRIVSEPVTIKKYTYGYFYNGVYEYSKWSDLLHDFPLQVEIVFTDGTTQLTEISKTIDNYFLGKYMSVSLGTQSDNNEILVIVRYMGYTASTTFRINEGEECDSIIDCRVVSKPQYSGVFPLGSQYVYSGTVLEFTLASGRKCVEVLQCSKQSFWKGEVTVDGHVYLFDIINTNIDNNEKTCYININDLIVPLAEIPVGDGEIFSIKMLSEPLTIDGVGSTIELTYDNGTTQIVKTIDSYFNRGDYNFYGGYLFTDSGFAIPWDVNQVFVEELGHRGIVYNLYNRYRFVYDLNDSTARTLALSAAKVFGNGSEFRGVQTPENIDQMFLTVLCYNYYAKPLRQYSCSDVEEHMRKIFNIADVDLTMSSYYDPITDTLAHPADMVVEHISKDNIFLDAISLYHETEENYVYKISEKYLEIGSELYIEVDRSANRITFIGTTYVENEIVSTGFSKLPAKTEYFIGDTLDVSDAVLEITYADGRIETVTEGFVVFGFDAYRAGVQPIAIAYGDILVNLEITVIRPQVQLSQEDLILHKGEILKLDAATNPLGQAVKWYSSDDYVADISDGEIVAKSVGSTTVTVEFIYNGITYSSTCQVTVKEPVLMGININKGPDCTVYELGSLLDTAGLELILTYSDGSTKVVTEGFTVEGFDSETVGEKILTIAYEDFVDTFTVTVKEPTLLGVVITKLPDKTEYEIGEALDTTGLTLKATYSNGYSEQITEGFDVSGLDSTTAGTKSVTVTYGEEILTFQVVVKEAVLTSISIASEPDKVEYEIGEELNTVGLSLTLVYSDGSTATISDDFTVSGFDSTSAGAKTVNVTYGGKTTTFIVTVNEPIIDENAPQIVLESKKVTKGKEFTVAVEIKNNPGFSYLEVTPVFSSELTLVKVENGSLISDFTKGEQYVWVADEDITEDGVLLTFIFSVNDSVEPGNYQVSFNVRTCGNYDEEAVTLDVVAANIEVIDYIYGDATGDGVVDVDDVIQLLLHVSMAEEFSIYGDADFTGDGLVDVDDVVQLLLHVSMPEIFPLQSA